MSEHNTLQIYHIPLLFVDRKGYWWMLNLALCLEKKVFPTTVTKHGRLLFPTLHHFFLQYTFFCCILSITTASKCNCDSKSSVCEPHNDGFVCNCRPGYISTNSTTCVGEYGLLPRLNTAERIIFVSEYFHYSLEM